jgi:transketolase
MGTVFVQGTTSTANLVKLLPDLDREGLNVKVVAAISPQLFRLQAPDYRARTVTPADRIDGMAITNRAARLMSDWVDGPLALEYSMGSDWDNRWRTGGTLDEVMDEAHLTPPYILAGIERFVRERDTRLRRVRDALEAAESRGSGGA